MGTSNDNFVTIGKIYIQTRTYIFGISETTLQIRIVGYDSPSYFEYLTDSYIQQKDVLKIESLKGNVTKLNWKIYSRRRSMLIKVS